jgi:hypothetical protein
VSNDDLAEHLSGFEHKTYIPEEMVNFMHPWRKTTYYPELENFLPKTDPEKFRFDQQVLNSLIAHYGIMCIFAKLILIL